ncbi:serine/arginine repetitive matrix protein 2-like [Wyeomyia smithii]|uniref:serine/arginine repetitive matrix protein 2-like n=1 Tax=Wyeomyia smithii TaxID=174621 RepID=UPI002468150D|nr:serine/arginine repetitive matrix protein 2-like [Wyeomyia smithii]
MSSYRSNYSYPWTSSYNPTTSFYSSSSSTHGSSRFSSEPSSSRFSSLSGSSFRPSYASGTYRSPRTASSNVSTYISRYSSLAADKEKEKEREKAKEEERRREREREREQREKEREKEREREKDRLIETSRKLEAELEKEKPKPIKKSALIAAKYGGTAESEETTKAGAKAAVSKPKKDNAPPVTYTTRYGKTGVTREKSREPSPAARSNSITHLTANRSKAPDASPAGGVASSKIRSRDPSPALDSKKTSGYAAAIASKLENGIQSLTREYKRQASNTAGGFLQNRARSRDPSPTVRTKTSREPSPVETKKITKSFTARSRDPSPAMVAKPNAVTSKVAPTETKKFSSSVAIRTGVRSRDPSPAESKKIPLFTSSKLRSRDPSPVSSKASTFSGGSLRTRVRDPSPVGAKPAQVYTRSHTALDKSTGMQSLTLPVTRARDPSPSFLKARSRDPSPALSTSGTRRSSREPSPAESIRKKYGLNSSSYRPYGRSNSALNTTSSRLPANSSPVPGGVALSYMTTNEATAARISRPSSRIANTQSREASQCPSPLLIRSQIFSPEPVQIVENGKKEGAEEDSSSTTDSTSSEEESSEETESSVEPEPKIFIEITLVTRGTSPTPPGSTPYIRARRAEMCKTVEKTIQKQLLNVQTADKAVQSDRMDDSTRYLRYNQPTTRNWSPFLDSKFSSSGSSGYTRYSSASSRYSRDSQSQSRETSVCSNRSDISTEKKDEKLSALAARVKEMSLSKSFSPKANTSGASRSSTSTPSFKQKTPPKQKSPEKPPPAPTKDGSPTKVATNATNSRINKDFRKSALNMGPAPDRPRKGSNASSKSSSSTSSASTATPTAETITQNGTSSRIPQNTRSSASPARRSDRSSSSSSEVSTSTTTSTTSTESGGKTRQSSRVTSSADPVTDTSNANNELLMRAIQLATNFVNKNPIGWNDTNSVTSAAESLDQGSKSGWEAGTHYMESIKDEDSSEEEEEDNAEDERRKSVLLQAKWWDNDTGVVQHAPVSAQDVSPQSNTLMYRIRPIQSGEKAWWMNDGQDRKESSDESPVRTNGGDERLETDEIVQNGEDIDSNTTEFGSPLRSIKLSKIKSGEKAWWMMSSDNIAAKSKTSSGSVSKAPSKETSPDKKSPGFTLYTLEAEDQAWWDEAMADLEKKEKSSTASSSSKAPSKESTPEPKTQEFIISRVKSGERAWWMCSTEKINETANSDGSVRECSPVKARPFKITRIESGEAPWWMTETENVTVSRSGSKTNVVSRSNSFNSKQSSPTKYKITRVESGEQAWWMDGAEEKSVSPQKLSSFIEKHGEEEHHQSQMDSELDEEIRNIGKFVAGLPQFPNGEFTVETVIEAPLGDRASPEGVEDAKDTLRLSPYDNIPTTGNASSSDAKTYQQTELDRKAAQSPVFISRHTNIDDLLGGSCHPLSPTIDRLFVMDGLQEISPQDVRVHDSTAQFIYGNRFKSGDDERLGNDLLDDAALQVYKDGDYGAYLDLESSLAEQSEEIEGLNASRKNSLVVRTQLSVRVHSIIDHVPLHIPEKESESAIIGIQAAR